MKKTAILSIVALLAFSVSAFAQERKVEFSDWEKQIKAADSTLNVLKAKEAACKEDGKNLKAKLEQTKANTAKTEEEILALVEANKDSKAAYGKELDAIENRIKQLAALSNDELFARRAELDVIEADLNTTPLSRSGGVWRRGLLVVPFIHTHPTPVAAMNDLESMANQCQFPKISTPRRPYGTPYTPTITLKTSFPGFPSSKPPVRTTIVRTTIPQ